MRAALRRRRRRLSPLPGTDPVQIANQHGNSKRSMRAIDDLPEAVRLAIKNSPFLIDITRAPRGMDWPQVIERIEALRTFEDASQFDKWLLHAGLRYRR